MVGRCAFFLLSSLGSVFLNHFHQDADFDSMTWTWAGDLGTVECAGGRDMQVVRDWSNPYPKF
jgi:hypothetical protein